MSGSHCVRNADSAIGRLTDIACALKWHAGVRAIVAATISSIGAAVNIVITILLLSSIKVKDMKRGQHERQKDSLLALRKAVEPEEGVDADLR